MLLWQSIILSIVEGTTEFLPISSTFHLLFATKVLGLVETDFMKFYTVFIQSAAILSVAVLFFKEWLRDFKLLKNVIISFVPTAVVGLVLHKVIKDVFFSSSNLMIGAFAVTGIAFILLEILIRQGKIKLEKSHDALTVPQALLIGVCQAMAVLPGVSRAGAVMVAMMLLGYKREDAAKYSFTLAIPTILAAAALDLLKSREAVLSASTNDFVMLGVGCVGAFISALIITKWFIQFLRSHSLIPFGIYRLLLSVILLIFRF